MQLSCHKQWLLGNSLISTKLPIQGGKIDEIFHDYESNKESMSQLTDLEIEEAIQEPPLERTDMA